nr:immunoglobulin light chain junction region [Macaca mulatta]MOW07177.1 immunoglobulin light chain junction region [Macaca mulatta]
DYYCSSYAISSTLLF